MSISALGYHLERLYGQKVPQCPRWPKVPHENPLDLQPLYERDSYRCLDCGWEINPRFLVWIPKDETARTRGEWPIAPWGKP